jgi:hypothetical protein
MTRWNGRLRKLDRADKVLVTGMVGFIFAGLGFLIALFVRAFAHPSVIPARLPFALDELAIGSVCLFIGVVLGLIATARTLRRLYRQSLARSASIPK